jgi:hypothetical protein
VLAQVSAHRGNLLVHEALHDHDVHLETLTEETADARVQMDTVDRVRFGDTKNKQPAELTIVGGDLNINIHECQPWSVYSSLQAKSFLKAWTQTQNQSSSKQKKIN